MAKLLFFIVVVFIFSFSAAKAQSAYSSSVHYITNGVSKFDSVIKRFRGQVIYMDMWATWCVPCRKELQDKKHMDAFTAFAAKNKVAVIYLSLDKDAKSWRQFVNANQLYGYHVLVNDSLHKELQARFSTDRIGNTRYAKKGLPLPRHMIIDRKGAIIDSTATERGSTYVYGKIGELLSK